jgi:tRNA (cmo5U34)-methyltransferase
MSNTISIKKYDIERANKYDNDSTVNQGNRDVHVEFLDHVLEFFIENNIINTPYSLLELGCGTGFFSKIILKKFPKMHAYLVDGSKSMIKIANKNLHKMLERITFINNDFNHINLEKFNNSIDLVFSALAIHHLNQNDKTALLNKIYNCMNKSSLFILYDLHNTDSELSNNLLEFIACKQIQKKTYKKLDLSFQIEELEINNLIKKDREIKCAENDQETTIKYHTDMLCTLGFQNITVFYQEHRFFGLVAQKI